MAKHEDAPKFLIYYLKSQSDNSKVPQELLDCVGDSLGVLIEGRVVPIKKYLSQKPKKQEDL